MFDKSIEGKYLLKENFLVPPILRDLSESFAYLLLIILYAKYYHPCLNFDSDSLQFSINHSFINSIKTEEADLENLKINLLAINEMIDSTGGKEFFIAQILDFKGAEIFDHWQLQSVIFDQVMIKTQ